MLRRYFVLCFRGSSLHASYHRIDKSVYGQHESGRQWSELHREWFISEGGKSCHAEPGFFHFDHPQGKVDVAVYVDDCVWCFENASVQQIFEEKYSKAFIANFAPCSKFLNCTVCQDLEAGVLQILLIIEYKTN